MNKIDGSILMVLISPDRRWAGPRKTKGAQFFPLFKSTKSIHVYNRMRVNQRVN
jgi:hypothetical protein